MKEINFENIINIIDSFFDDEMYEDIANHAEMNKEYSEFKENMVMFLERYPKMEKVDMWDACTIEENDIKYLNEYQRMKEQEKKLLMKEAYYRGISDMLSIINRIK
ncbi:MAG: hypothetical protein LUG60_03290 [Erysipelotrichaceae bacterium]|nr:hypothetical protein [Erysipelotrichaceae bacterium]